MSAAALCRVAASPFGLQTLTLTSTPSPHLSSRSFSTALTLSPKPHHSIPWLLLSSPTELNTRCHRLAASSSGLQTLILTSTPSPHLSSRSFSTAQTLSPKPHHSFPWLLLSSPTEPNTRCHRLAASSSCLQTLTLTSTASPHLSSRSFSTAQTLSPKPHHSVPCLLLSSPTEPNTRYLADHGDAKISREISLPSLAGHNIVGSSNGHLFSVDPSIELHATNPLTGSRLKLPPTTTLPGIAAVVSCDCCDEVVEFVRSRYSPDPPSEIEVSPYTLHLVGDGRRIVSRTKSGRRSVAKLDRLESHGEIETLGLYDMRFYYRKAILSPERDIAVVIQGGDAERLAFARVGDDKWTDLFAPIEDFQDMIFHKGKLHAINDTGTLAVFDLEKPSEVPVLSPRGPLDETKRCIGTSLVESPDGEELFLVAKVPPSKAFATYKLDMSSYRWRMVESLGYLAMFLGSNHSVAVSSCDFPDVNSNHIYFTDYYQEGYKEGPVRAYDTGVFNVEEGDVEFYSLKHRVSHGLQRLNWPPPVWFMPSAATA